MKSVDKWINSNRVNFLPDEHGHSGFRVSVRSGAHAYIYPPKHHPELSPEDVELLERVFQLLADIEYELYLDNETREPMLGKDILLMLSLEKWKVFFSFSDENRLKAHIIDRYADVLREFHPDVSRTFVRMLTTEVYVERFYPQWQFAFPTDEEKARIRERVAELIDILMTMWSGFAKQGMDWHALWSHIIEGMRHTIAPDYFHINDTSWHKRFYDKVAATPGRANIEISGFRERLTRLLSSIAVPYGEPGRRADAPKGLSD